MSGTPGCIVLCGLDRLGFRTLQELVRLGESVVVIIRVGNDSFVDEARALGATILEGDYRQERMLRAAGVAEATAAVIIEDDDVGNLHAALAVQEINPDARIVLRMFNLEFGERVRALFRDCTVFSASAIAAPAFVSAALHHGWEQQIEVEGRVLMVRQGSASEPDVLLPLACVRGESTTLFPAEGDDLLCLAEGSEASRARHAEGQEAKDRGRRTWRPGEWLATPWVVLTSVDRRLHYLMLILLVLMATSATLFYVFAGLDPIDALYFTTTVITNANSAFADINLRDAPTALKIYGIVLTLLGAAALAVLYALITDAIVAARLTRALGGPRRRMRDHVVVCGLGNIGYRVVEQIARMGLPVSAAELHETCRFLPAARRLGVPVLVGDARLVETLQLLNVGEARCLIVATNDDLANLEAALNGRSLKPDLRVVLRLFEPDLARRVQQTFGIDISRSASALAAPRFAAATVGQHVVATLPIGSRVLLVARVQVEPGSRAEGQTIGDVEDGDECRVLRLALDGRETWCPERNTSLGAGQELVVVATRGGLARVIASTRRH